MQPKNDDIKYPSSQLSDKHVVADVLAAEEVERAQVGAVPREGVERLRVQKVALGENLNLMLRNFFVALQKLLISKSLEKQMPCLSKSSPHLHSIPVSLRGGRSGRDCPSEKRGERLGTENWFGDLQCLSTDSTSLL